MRRKKKDDSPVALVVFYICGGLRGCNLYETHTCAHVHGCVCRFKHAHAQMHILLIHTLVLFFQCTSTTLSFSVIHTHMTSVLVLADAASCTERGDGSLTPAVCSWKTETQIELAQLWVCARVCVCVNAAMCACICEVICF